jgi:hypothetical protein
MEAGALMTTKKTVKALRFTQPGAPQDFCSVVGVPGLLHPQYPAPVGGPGEVPEPIAGLFDKDPGCPVELVSITEAQADEYRKHVDIHRRKAGQ